MKHVLLALGAIGASLAARTSHGTSSPVEKVVQLLRDLKTKIEEDGTTEQQTYDKFACWCEKTTDRKAKAIAAAQDEIRSLGQKILKLKGQVATLLAEIAQLSADIKANEEAQATATAIRQKENAEFMAETTEMKEVLAALAKAIEVLKMATQSASFLQQGSVALAIRRVVEVLPSSLSVKPSHLSMLRSFSAAHDHAKYAPQSLTVQGILSDMFDTFSKDLETATEAEGTKNRQYEDFMAQKHAELVEMQEQVAKKEEEKAEAETMLADSTQAYDDTEAQMKADIVFFDETKASCESKHAEWTTRSQLRAEELAGINQAIEILSSDDARQLFASAIKPGKETHVDESYDPGTSFFQLMGEGSATAPVARAYAALKAPATTLHSLRLAGLAAKVRLAKVGHFDEVIKAIDTMIQTLKDEGAEDIKKRDQCLEEYQKIKSKIAHVEWLIKKNNAKIDKLTVLIEDLDKEKAETIQAIADTIQEITDMKAQRKTENDAFLAAKKEDQDAISLLKQAKEALSAYYTKHSIELGPLQGAALAQQGPEFEVSPDQAPEATFSGKGKRKHESKGILQLLTMIMEDLEDEIRNAMKAEELAQLDFEKQLKAAEAVQAELEAKKVSLESMIAKRTQERTDEKTALEDNEKDLKAEQDYRSEIKPDCDLTIDKFDKRVAARTTELDALVAAKEYLAGYSPEAAFLERTPSHSFDDSALSRIDFQGLSH